MEIFYGIIFLLATNYIDCAKILGVFPSPGYSQFILCEMLMKSLASRGHEVTVINAYEPKNVIKNYTTVLVDRLRIDDDLFGLEDESEIEAMISIERFAQMWNEVLLSDEKVQKLIHSNTTFDLVIVETLLNEAHMGFAAHFKAPLILFNSIGLSDWNSHLSADVRLPSIIPMVMSNFGQYMTFFQRVKNSILSFIDVIYKQYVRFPEAQKLLTKYFPGDLRLKDIMYNSSLLLLNSDIATTQPTSLTQSTVEIGGFHIVQKKLPANIQTFLDGAENGAILFSMGSNLNTTNLGKAKLTAVLNTFSKLKQRIIWKFEKVDLINKPKNVMISGWLPQSDVLAHPNVVAFITHGGMLSTTEALHYGVPMLGIPVFLDQRMNVARAVEKGLAIYLPFKEISEETLTSSLKELLENPKYRETAKKYSTIINDKIVKPIDLAMYWVEYVLKHGGAHHLRNSAIDLHWYQLYMIDVFSFVAVCIGLIFYLTRISFKLFFRKNKNNHRSKENKLKNERKKTT